MDDFVVVAGDILTALCRRRCKPRIRLAKLVCQLPEIDIHSNVLVFEIMVYLSKQNQ